MDPPEPVVLMHRAPTMLALVLWPAASLGLRTTGLCRYEIGPGEYDHWSYATRPARVAAPRH